MNAFEAVVLGLVQGLTEFLPISSSAHLRIVPELFGWGDPGAAFTAVIQLGTMAAVLIYFRRDLWRISMAWLRGLTDRRQRRTHDAMMGWYLIAATVPIGVFGLIFADQIETGARDLRVIGTTLIVLGLALYGAERVARRQRTLDDLGVNDGLTIGAAQALALVPGVSRSGSTITAGLLLGYTREAAARFSFLLSVPAVVLSGLFELRHLFDGGGPSATATVIATVVSFVSGYAAIAWLLRYLVRHSTSVFVVYRVALGLLVLSLVLTGTLDAR